MNNTYNYHSNQVYDRDFAVDYHDFERGDPMTYLLASLHTGAMNDADEFVKTRLVWFSFSSS